MEEGDHGVIQEGGILGVDTAVGMEHEDLGAGGDSLVEQRIAYLTEERTCSLILSWCECVNVLTF